MTLAFVDANSKLVEVVAVAEERVGNSLFRQDFEVEVYSKY